jgi:hypothetical protein
MKRTQLALAAALLALALPASAPAQELFSDTVGKVTVADVKVKAGDVIDLPFLTWGGDVATFMGNGGKDKTKKDTPFDKLGLKFNMVNGDDFVGQVKNYLEGKTPFLRGTVSQIGQASEVLGKDPRTKPVVFLQLTWSAGDHMVARPTCKTLNDLKGKKIALQKGGPHVGMLDDVLRSAKLTWKDVTVVWTDDVTGDKGPAALFRKDKAIDACFVISPDMTDLTFGLDKEGDGSEKSVKGAKVLVSTVYLSRSIADVYACRKDFYDKNKAMIEKLTGAYLAGCEELVALRKNYDLAPDKRNKAQTDKYKPILTMCQDIFGKEVIPDLEAAHGLISDATFVGLPGNVAFFTDKNNLTGFAPRMKAAMDVATGQGYAKERIDPAAAELDYSKVQKYGDLKVIKGEDDKPIDDKPIDPDANAIYFFTIGYEANKLDFPLEKYEKDFAKVVEDARLYGHTRFQVRGHSDVTKVLSDFVKAGLQTGLLRRVKDGDKFKYYLVKDGKEIDLTDTKKVLALVETLDFTGADDNPKATLDAAKKLSEDRANKVREAVIDYAKKKSLNLNASQLKAVGVGVAEPIIAKPKNEDEAALNRRVEFKVLKPSGAELTQKKDFDF